MMFTFLPQSLLRTCERFLNRNSLYSAGFQIFQAALPLGALLRRNLSLRNTLQKHVSEPFSFLQ